MKLFEMRAIVDEHGRITLPADAARSTANTSSTAGDRRRSPSGNARDIFTRTEFAVGAVFSRTSSLKKPSLRHPTEFWQGYKSSTGRLLKSQFPITLNLLAWISGLKSLKQKGGIRPRSFRLLFLSGRKPFTKRQRSMMTNITPGR